MLVCSRGGEEVGNENKREMEGRTERERDELRGRDGEKRLLELNPDRG